MTRALTLTLTLALVGCSKPAPPKPSEPTLRDDVQLMCDGASHVDAGGADADPRARDAAITAFLTGALRTKEGKGLFDSLDHASTARGPMLRDSAARAGIASCALADAWTSEAAREARVIDLAMICGTDWQVLKGRTLLQEPESIQGAQLLEALENAPSDEAARALLVDALSQPPATIRHLTTGDVILSKSTCTLLLRDPPQGLRAKGVAASASASASGSASSVAAEMLSPSVKGGLSKDDVSTTIQRAVPRLRACFAQGRRADPKLRPQVEFHLHVGVSGNVEDAILDRPLSPEEELAQCVQAVLRALVFPPSETATDVRTSIDLAE